MIEDVDGGRHPSGDLQIQPAPADDELVAILAVLRAHAAGQVSDVLGPAPSRSAWVIAARREALRTAAVRPSRDGWRLAARTGGASLTP